MQSTETRELNSEKLKNVIGGIVGIQPCSALDQAPDNEGIERAEDATDCEIHIL